MKTVSYEARGWVAFVEEDSYADGCIGGGSIKAGDDFFSAPTRPELLAKLAAFCGATVGDAELNACGEAGRVDFGMTEDENGSPLTAAEIEKWKAGAMRAWYAVYTFHCERVEREPLEFSGE